MNIISIQSQSSQLVDRQFVQSYIQKKHLQFPFQRSSCGVTGQTFLPLDPNFKWVVKWQNQFQAEAEYLCSELFRRVFPHTSVPRTELVTDSKFCKDLATFFNKEKALVASFHKPFFMEYMNGRNLKKFAEFYGLFSLNEEQLLSLGVDLGKVAGYDQLIGNTDRFLPEAFNGKLNKYHNANTGNILIEMDDDKIVRVHLIDNVPFFDDFFAREEVPINLREIVTADLVKGTGSLFDSSSYSEESSISLSEDFSEEERGGHDREGFHEDFLYFMNAHREQLTQMAEQVYIGIMNDIDSITKPGWEEVYEDFKANAEKKEAFIQGVTQGLVDAQKEITSAPLMEVVSELRKEKDWEENTSEILLDFIEENIEAIPKQG